jgi:endonuclease/exonuclease/phosphatase family metal-dependent hydrolase
MLDLVALLGEEYPYSLWLPGMIYNPWLVEGLGVLSKYPIMHSWHFKLGKCEGDGNQRILLVVRVNCPIGVVDFMVTHWTYKPRGQLAQASKTLNFAREIAEPSVPQILVGDFNVKTSHQRPVQFLEGLAQNEHGDSGDFIDTWKVLNAHSRGKTHPVWRPRQRFDRILVRGGLGVSSVGVIGVIEQEEPEQLHASDHCLVLAELTLPQ